MVSAQSLLLIVLLYLVKSNGQQILPPSLCLACRTYFISNGCVNDQSSTLCKLLAFKLLFEVNNRPLCNAFPCEGYGQAPLNECRGFFTCPPSDVNILGICGGLDVCCTVSQVAVDSETRNKSFNLNLNISRLPELLSTRNQRTDNGFLNG